MGSTELDSYILPEGQFLAAKIRQLKYNPLSKGKIKDEFEHMVNWKRVFEQIWQQIRWLTSFAMINELALRKIMKKFVKNYFEIKDNTLTRKLSQMIDATQFKLVDGKMTRELQILSDDVLSFYAQMFYKGDEGKAR